MNFTRIRWTMRIFSSLEGEYLNRVWTSWHAPISPKENLEIFIIGPKALAKLGVKQCIDFID